MEDYAALLLKTPLFASIGPGDLPALLECLKARTITIPKDGYALLAGDPVEHIGIVLEGQLQITREDVDGVRALVAVLQQGDIYAEALSCAGVVKSPVSVRSVVPAKVMQFKFHRILTACPHSCEFHIRLIENMVGIIARKNLYLQNRMEVLSKKTIREKVLFYLGEQCHEKGRPFIIPLNRNELADYLSVDRSALSRELGHLQDEGALSFHKNTFVLSPQHMC